MPPKSKKAAAAKKEELADPHQVTDGRCDYYVGGWSFLQDITCVTDISHSVIAAHTREDRTVESLPRTNVLVLPLLDGDSGMAAAVSNDEADDDATTTTQVVELADKMQVEGVPWRAVLGETENMKSWEPSPIPEAAPAVEDAAESTADAEPVTAAPVVSSDDAAATTVTLRGAMELVGVLPPVVVQPVLPVRADPAAESAAAAGGGKTDAKAKRKRGTESRQSEAEKAKLTPEELAAREQQKAEEEALFLKQTEEAVALASAQEEHLMSFAHPARWATVLISNMIFTGPVTVRRAHVTFQNCCFTYTGTGQGARPQLTVSQYCSVSCVKCTFDAPAGCGLYALPTASVTITKCLFTGVPHRELTALSYETECGAAVGGAVARVDVAAGANEAADDETAAAADQSESNTSAAAMGSSRVEQRASTDNELLRVGEAAAAGRPLSVGVQVDCSKAAIDHCEFLFLHSGVVFHSGSISGSSPTAPDQQHGKKIARRQAAAVVSVQHSKLHHMLSTAVVVETCDVLLQHNEVSDCGYYGLDCRGASCRRTVVQHNKFGVDAKVRIREGAAAQLLHNSFQSVPINDNKIENPCLSPVY